MEVKVIRLSMLLSILGAAIFAFIKPTVSTGLLLGSLFATLYYFQLSTNITSVLIKQEYSKASNIISHFIRITFLMLPMLIACLLPKYFNVFGAFAGLMLFRISLYVLNFREKKK